MLFMNDCTFHIFIVFELLSKIEHPLRLILTFSQSTFISEMLLSLEVTVHITGKSLSGWHFLRHIK